MSQPANDEFSQHLSDDEALNHEDASDTGAAPKQQQAIPQITTISNIKLPILKKEEYDIWAMEIEHYLKYIDNEVWKVIQNGNSKKRILTGKDGEHMRRFHGMDDAKEIREAIRTSSEGLEKGYDRFQQLLSQLEAHGAEVSTEDANHKFLRVNHANQFVPRSVQLNTGRTNINSVRPNINTGRVNVNSVRPNVNTGRVNVNSVRPNVNTGRVNVNSVKSNVNTGRTNVNPVRPRVNTGSSNVNTVRSRQPVPTKTSNSFSPKRPQVNQLNQRRHFSKSHSPVSRPIVRNTTRMTYSHAVKGNWGTAVKTSAGYNWRKTRPNSNYDSGPTFIRTVITKGPQGRPKLVKAWPDLWIVVLRIGKLQGIGEFSVQTASELAIPGQTTTGKESSNPFMAGSLPKTVHLCDSLQSDEDSEDASKQGKIVDADAEVTFIDETSSNFKQQKMEDDKETALEV
ncbi:hypothetical protein Tco_1261505, partial [Tanacetum coccineum]